MFANKNKFYISREDYLEGEKVSPIKHEYRKGRVYAMTGAKNAHVLISLNLASILKEHLLKTECLTFMADTKLRLEEANCYYYPDVAITCDERDINSDEYFILVPTLIIEIFSPKTEVFDRGIKFADYQTSPNLREYVLVNQSQKQVECFRLNEEGIWVSQIYNLGDEVEFKSLDFRCPIDSIYLKVPGIVN
jgi:Uma2 family endonuclease